ncbi:uncharacterized protein EHS24_007205 [Apiotrichum porosum]|uniref:Uncharacterized protein n=1 Tax=Apiotrichum porosum TaxID=105984 RepID=A0A427XXB1_9TREE|nr:uncharacterized protein EHS24_007205 [Apiotrichum porosum]RSH83518.1 hypothetical protein EHS24_007205 [Apiotrichum porosum]
MGGDQSPFDVNDTLDCTSEATRSRPDPWADYRVIKANEIALNLVSQGMSKTMDQAGYSLTLLKSLYALHEYSHAAREQHRRPPVARHVLLPRANTSQLPESKNSLYPGAGWAIPIRQQRTVNTDHQMWWCCVSPGVLCANVTSSPPAEGTAPQEPDRNGQLDDPCR